MRAINLIFLHCTATSQSATIPSIQKYWKEKLKWNNPGYHYLIESNGKVTQLQPEEKPSNGVAGHNSNSIHISYIGGIDSKGKALDNRTPEQIQSQVKLINQLLVKYPSAKVAGHNQFSSKACPSFDTVKWLTGIGIDKKNIYVKK
jgi:N-acetylmuramoyl-L-alanine amidase